MIPWLYTVNEFEQFCNLKSKERQRIIDKKRAHVDGQRLIIEETTKSLRKSSRSVSRRVRHGDKHRATEEISINIIYPNFKNSEPILTNYSQLTAIIGEFTKPCMLAVGIDPNTRYMQLKTLIKGYTR